MGSWLKDIRVQWLAGELLVVVVVLAVAACVHQVSRASADDRMPRSAGTLVATTVNTAIAQRDLVDLLGADMPPLATLDDTPVGAGPGAASLFADLLEGGLVCSAWQKVDTCEYVFLPTGRAYSYSPERRCFYPTSR